MTAPSAPDDLLARCLATIPATATVKPSAPRLSVGDGSRKRLAWLSLAATVPVVTMLAILPANRLLEKSHALQQTADVPISPERVDYVRAHVNRWMIYTQDTNRIQVVRDGETRHILDRKRGMIYQVLRYHDDAKKVTGDWNQLSLPDGKQYVVQGNTISRGHLGSRFNQVFDITVDALLKHGAIQGFNNIDSSVQGKNIRAKSFLPFATSGKTAILEVTQYVIPKGGTDIFVSGKSTKVLDIVRERLLVGKSRRVERMSYYLCNPSGERDAPCAKTKVYSATFDYSRAPGEERDLDPRRFPRLSKTAKPVDKS